MMVNECLERLPQGKGAVVVLSGGMDSTIAARLAVEKYGKSNVKALTFYYGQRQYVEIQKAKDVVRHLDIDHAVIDAAFLGEISQGFSANVDKSVIMPTIKEVLGDPRPKTYVPNRNMILLSIAAAFAEVQGVENIICGLQVHDEYNYHDTTQRFVDKLNDVLNENRIIKIKIIAPFSELSKFEEIQILKELDGNVGLLQHTLTCYNPTTDGRSCGKCPSCSERIANFAMAGVVDPVKYDVDLDWPKLFSHYGIEV